MPSTESHSPHQTSSHQAPAIQRPSNPVNPARGQRTLLVQRVKRLPSPLPAVGPVVQEHAHIIVRLVPVRKRLHVVLKVDRSAPRRRAGGGDAVTLAPRRVGTGSVGFDLGVQVDLRGDTRSRRLNLRGEATLYAMSLRRVRRAR